jgi:Na+-transporting methylmalonyl-CoA/oxaloacetate decarboxylase gamma subunit
MSYNVCPLHYFIKSLFIFLVLLLIDLARQANRIQKAATQAVIESETKEAMSTKASERAALAAAAAAALEDKPRFPAGSWPGVRIDEFTVAQPEAPKEEVARAVGRGRRGTGNADRSPRRGSLTSANNTASSPSRGSTPRRSSVTPGATPRSTTTPARSRRASISAKDQASSSAASNSTAAATTADGQPIQLDDGNPISPNVGKFGASVVAMKTVANRAVIAARDQAYRYVVICLTFSWCSIPFNESLTRLLLVSKCSEYLDAFRGHTSSIVNRAASMEREQQLRRQRWLRLVQQLKDQ